MVFSACYHWWICLLVWLLSLFLFFFIFLNFFSFSECICFFVWFCLNRFAFTICPRVLTVCFRFCCCCFLFVSFLLMSVCVYVSLCDFVCIVLLFPFGLGFYLLGSFCLFACFHFFFCFFETCG